MGLLACGHDEVAAIAVGLSLVGGTSVLICGIIATQWRRTRIAAYDARIKQLMLERGMSVEEIERVVGVEPTPRGWFGRRRKSPF